LHTFCKKSDLIHAVRWDGHPDTANTFLGESYSVDWEYISKMEKGKFSCDIQIPLPNSEHKLLARVGDWIIRESDGTVRVREEDVFHQQYELVR